MKKANFATRITVLGTTKLSAKENVSGAAAQNRAILQADINKHKVSVNRDVFTKTQAEKDVLKLRKTDKSYEFDNAVIISFNSRG